MNDAIDSSAAFARGRTQISAAIRSLPRHEKAPVVTNGAHRVGMPITDASGNRRSRPARTT